MLEAGPRTDPPDRQDLGVLPKKLKELSIQWTQFLIVGEKFTCPRTSTMNVYSDRSGESMSPLNVALNGPAGTNGVGALPHLPTMP